MERQDEDEDEREDAEDDDEREDAEDDDDEREDASEEDAEVPPSPEEDLQAAQEQVFVERRHVTDARRAGVKPPKISKHGHMRTHPLFPLEEDAEPYKRKFVWIHISRRNPDTGQMENYPDRFPAGRLQTWQDVVEIGGGGDYRIWATNEDSRYTAFFPAGVGDVYHVPGPSKPFFKQSTSGVVRAKVDVPAPAPVAAPAPAAPAVPTLKDFQEMIDKAVAARMSAPASPAPVAAPSMSTAELMAAGSTAIASIVTAILSRPPPPPPPDTMTPLLKMMEIQSAERNAQLQAAAAAGSKSDSATDLLKVMLASRDKPMGAAEMVQLVAAMRGNDKPMSAAELVALMKTMKDDGGINGVLDLMKKVKEIQGPTVAAPPSDIDEVAKAVTAITPVLQMMKNDSPAAPTTPAQKPAREVLVPGIGVMTNPSPQLMARLNEMGASMIGGVTPSASTPSTPSTPSASTPQAASPAVTTVTPKPPPKTPQKTVQAKIEPVKIEPAKPVKIEPVKIEPAELSEDEAAAAFVARLQSDPTFHARVAERLNALPTPVPVEPERVEPEPVEPEPVEPEPVEIEAVAHAEVPDAEVPEAQANPSQANPSQANPSQASPNATLVSVPKLPDGLKIEDLPPSILELAQQNPEVVGTLMRGGQIDLTDALAGLPPEVAGSIKTMLENMGGTA